MKTDLSLYIHIPFCVQKCRYCDFVSGPASDETKERYVKRLIEEIGQKAKEYDNYRVVTIYFGGGTPSVLDIKWIELICDEIRKAFVTSSNPEITLEVNPGTVNRDKLDKLRKLGINRLSIGLQSSIDEELELLGRIHRVSDFENTFRNAREVGFDNISVDLMSALPGQSIESYKRSLDYVIELSPEHISSYSFQLEENTWFWNHRQEFNWPDEELDRQLYELTGTTLEEAGYFRYEISNYSKIGFESRHNSVYWTRGNYLGVGLAAASCVDNVRFKNTESLDAYLNGSSIVEKEELSVKEQMEEFMFLGLRMMKGISPDSFKTEFNEDIMSVYGEQINKLVEQQLLTFDGNYHLSRHGIDISNYVLTSFIFD